MKINPEIRHQDLALHVSDQLDFISVSDVRASIIIMNLIMYDGPLLLGLSYILRLDFLWIILPFILIIHLWGIRLVIKNPYSTQLEMILYIGVWGLLGAISLFITVLGVMYYTFHITSAFFYVIMILVTIISAYILLKYQINKYAGDPTKEIKKSNQSKYMLLLSTAPGLGYLSYQTIKGTGVLESAILTAVIYLFAIFFVYVAAKFLHRYFFIRTNMKYVTYQPITTKEKKKIIKQGVEIK